LWTPAVRRQHPGVADQHVQAAEAVDRVLDDVLDRGEVANVGRLPSPLPRRWRRAVARLRKRVLAQVAEHQVGVRLGRQLLSQGVPSVPPPRRMAMTRRALPIRVFLLAGSSLGDRFVPGTVPVT